MNLRHKHLAHSLTETKLEKKAGRVAPMKYGDERKILLESLSIAEALHGWVSKGFSFANSQEIGPQQFRGALVALHFQHSEMSLYAAGVALTKACLDLDVAALCPS